MKWFKLTVRKKPHHFVNFYLTGLHKLVFDDNQTHSIGFTKNGLV